MVASYCDDMNPLPLIALLSAVLAAPAIAGSGIAVDVPVTSPTPARAAGTQRHPLAATNGSDFFAVWIDSRGGFASLYGTRVLADGTVLDPAGILISAPEQFCDSFALVWDGSNYVVVWQADSRVNFARVDRDGVVLGPPQTVFNRDTQPLIASNGHGTVVIAHALFFQSNVIVAQDLIALISQNGIVTQEAAIPELSANVQIASNGDGYLLSWADLSVSSTALLRLDNNGNPFAGSAQLLPEAAYTQLTAATDGAYLLVRRKSSGGASCAQSIVGRLVTGSGLSDPFLIHDSGGSNIQDVAVAADGNGFEVVWMRRAGTIECPSGFSDPGPPPSPPFDLERVHVGPDGRSGTPSTLTEGDGSHEQPAIASNGVTQAVLWTGIDAARRTAKIAGAIADQRAEAAPLHIASSAPAQSEPAIAAGEGLFMTAWSEEKPIDGTSAVYARRFDTEGHALDAAAIRVSTNDQPRTFTPAVSFDGMVWLFVWSEDSKVVARRMALDGSWIDPTPMTLGAGFWKRELRGRVERRRLRCPDSDRDPCADTHPPRRRNASGAGSAQPWIHRIPHLPIDGLGRRRLHGGMDPREHQRHRRHPSRPGWAGHHPTLRHRQDVANGVDSFHRLPGSGVRGCLVFGWVHRRNKGAQRRAGGSTGQRDHPPRRGWVRIQPEGPGHARRPSTALDGMEWRDAFSSHRPDQPERYRRSRLPRID
jgi:hypothetical protein